MNATADFGDRRPTTDGTDSVDEVDYAEAAPESAPHIRVEDETSWRSLLISRETKNGTVVLPNLTNAITILRHHPGFRDVFAWDAFGERIVCRRPPPWHAVVAPNVADTGAFRETDIARLIDWLAREEGLAITPRIVEQAVPVVAEAQSFHPVREYLLNLEWDGVPRLENWLAKYAGAEQSAYTAAIGTKWMISAVARPMDPGCQVDSMIVLEGPQGAGKSSLFRSLVPHPSMYSETGVTIGDKDSYQALHGIWVFLLDELDSLKRGDITRTKNFLTAPKDHFRPSYGRMARDFPRQCCFAGTTNESEYLPDKTGNRRYWPVKVVGPIDIAALARDRDQLWAEAFERYAQGEHWYANTPQLRALCEAEQAERVQQDPWLTVVADWLAEPFSIHIVENEHSRKVEVRRPYKAPNPGFLTEDIVRYALGKDVDRIGVADTMRVAACLKELGYERGGRVTENGSRVRRYHPAAGPPGPPEKQGGPGGGPDQKTNESETLSTTGPPGPPKEVRRKESEEDAEIAFAKLERQVVQVVQWSGSAVNDSEEVVQESEELFGDWWARKGAESSE